MSRVAGSSPGLGGQRAVRRRDRVRRGDAEPGPIESPEAARGRPATVPDELLVWNSGPRQRRPCRTRCTAHATPAGADHPGLDVQVVQVRAGTARATARRLPPASAVVPSPMAWRTRRGRPTIRSTTDRPTSSGPSTTPGALADAGSRHRRAPGLGRHSRSPTSTIAIVDTGIMADHPDLQGKVVDSRNWYDGSGTQDVVGHGTHVAGIAAATTNNGLGNRRRLPGLHAPECQGVRRHGCMYRTIAWPTASCGRSGASGGMRRTIA